MKIAIIVVRILVGLMFLFASISYFAEYYPGGIPEMSDEMNTFNAGLGASRYMMPLIKTLELLCGLAFVSGRFVALANLVILPITLNILLVNAYMAPEGLPMVIPLFLGNLFLIYAYWGHYKTVVTPK